MTLLQAIRKAKELNKKYNRTYLVCRQSEKFRVDSDIHCSCWPKVVWSNTEVYKLICSK